MGSTKERKTITLDSRIAESIEKLARKEGSSFSRKASELLKEQTDKMMNHPSKVLHRKKATKEEEIMDLMEERKDILDKLTNDMGQDILEDVWAHSKLNEKIEEIDQLLTENREQENTGTEF